MRGTRAEYSVFGLVMANAVNDIVVSFPIRRSEFQKGGTFGSDNGQNFKRGLSAPRPQGTYRACGKNPLPGSLCGLIRRC